MASLITVSEKIYFDFSLEAGIYPKKRSLLPVNNYCWIECSKEASAVPIYKEQPHWANGAPDLQNVWPV